MFLKKGPSIATGILFTAVLAALLYFDLPVFRWIMRTFERVNYSLNLRYFHTHLPANSPVIIVDIDDESLDAVGRWPWPRKKLAELVSNLYDAQAKVVVLDLIFSEEEKNRAEEVVELLNHLSSPPSQEVISQIKRVEAEFDYDAQFAEQLKRGPSILAFAFRTYGDSQGKLASPLLVLTKEEQEKIFIQEESSYICNIELLQNAAKSEGFINAETDVDGIVRYTYAFLRYGSGVYPSLGLEAARIFRGDEKVELVLGNYDGAPLLEGALFGQTKVPLDPWGRMLIPFRGPPYTVSYLSAKDILAGKVPQEILRGKLVFIGASATALGDVFPTPIAPIFPSVEIHAHIASGILDGYMPHEPVWGRRVSSWLGLSLGFVLACVFPFVGPAVASLIVLVLFGLLIGLNIWVWSGLQLLIPGVFPLVVVFSVYVLNEVTGYIFERRKRQRLKILFGHYVPPERVDRLLEEDGEQSLKGESKELTVLFSDIRGFTAMSENLSASQVKDFLNDYFTPLTETIFRNKGTVDKYIGDMVMAFWGAPIDDPDHPLDAMKAAFGMLEDLKRFNQSLEKKGLEKISIGIGINTGLMNVGDMGSKFRQAYTVLGDSVNIASRLEHTTKFFHVPLLVGEKTYEKTFRQVVYKKLDKVRLRGKQKRVIVYQAMGMKGEILPEILTEIQLHEEALESYFKQNWAQARKGFMKLKEFSKNPVIANIFLERITEFEKSTLPSWDGSSVAESDF